MPGTGRLHYGVVHAVPGLHFRRVAPPRRRCRRVAFLAAPAPAGACADDRCGQRRAAGRRLRGGSRLSGAQESGRVLGRVPQASRLQAYRRPSPYWSARYVETFVLVLAAAVTRLSGRLTPFRPGDRPADNRELSQAAHQRPEPLRVQGIGQSLVQHPDPGRWRGLVLPFPFRNQRRAHRLDDRKPSQRTCLVADAAMQSARRWTATCGFQRRLARSLRRRSDGRHSCRQGDVPHAPRAYAARVTISAGVSSIEIDRTSCSSVDGRSSV